MKIGIPKELKNNENRVGMTPAGVAQLVARGHQVYVQATAGIGSGFADEDYVAVGATMLPTIEEVYGVADMIVKVKEPVPQEYPLIKFGQIVFTYFHFACDKALTDAMIASGGVCVAYETVRTADGALPLLTPMSEGVRPAKVVVLGGGIVGQAAARTAAGLGADVVILDISLPKLRELSITMPANVRTVYSSPHHVESELADADVVIGAVLVPGDKAPKLVTRDMLAKMRPGTVMVDVAIDQGGCFETSRPTTHSDPVYEVDGILHYCVANIPGAIPHTSTSALANATLSYAVALADKGWKKACQDDPALAEGLNIVEGKVVYKAVADVFGLPYEPLTL